MVIPTTALAAATAALPGGGTRLDGYGGGVDDSDGWVKGNVHADAERAAERRAGTKQAERCRNHRRRRAAVALRLRQQRPGTDGPSTLDFTVQLSAPSAYTVTVEYETVDGTAVAGTHYTAAAGTLTFAPGETEQTITVTIIGDETKNEDRTFQLTLSQPSYAVIVDSAAVGVIVDDDLVYLFLPVIENNYPPTSPRR